MAMGLVSLLSVMVAITSVGGVDGIVGRFTIESPHPRLNWQVDPCMATTQIGRG